MHTVMYSYFYLMAIDAKPEWLKCVPPLRAARLLQSERMAELHCRRCV